MKLAAGLALCGSLATGAAAGMQVPTMMGAFAARNTAIRMEMGRNSIVGLLSTEDDEAPLGLLSAEDEEAPVIPKQLAVIPKQLSVEDEEASKIVGLLSTEDDEAIQGKRRY